MAYTNNVVNGATLRALCAWCDAKDLHLIMDDTLGSFRLSGDLCSWNGVINFYPHGYIFGSKTFGCASLWIKSNLVEMFSVLVPNFSGSHVLEDCLARFKRTYNYVAKLSKKRYLDAETVRKHYNFCGGPFFWWINVPATDKCKWILQLMKNWRYDKRILVPFDFDFKLVLQKIREEKKNSREVEKERAKNRKRKREQRARNALLPKFEMVKVNSTLLVPFGMANMAEFFTEQN